MKSKKNKRTLFSSASIAAAAFNLPVMVIAGLIIGYLLSVNQESPLKELVQIGLPMIFFIIAVFELYYTANKQKNHRVPSKTSFISLTQLIASKEEEEEEDDKKSIL